MNGFERPHERIFGYTDAGQSWDGEEIVRCRDCEHSRRDGTLCIFFAGWPEDGDEYTTHPAEVEPDGFCKWGRKRKEQR